MTTSPSLPQSLGSEAMKVRIGVGMGPSASPHGADGPADETVALVDELERRDVDSIWLGDRLSAPALDPIVALAHAAGRTRSLKLGTGVLVLPGRNPALMAAELASLAVLAPKRILPAFGLTPATRTERTSFPVAGPRVEVFEESLVAVRRLLTEESVTFHGRWVTLDGATVSPRPERPLDLWLGGLVPAALDRVGRLADGWLASFVTPAEADRARRRIADAADRAGREIEPDHYGTNLLVLPPGADPSEAEAALASVTRRRPEVERPADLIASSWDEAADQVRAFVDVGITKFVVRPAVAPRSWSEFLDGLGATLQPLETRSA